MNRKRRLDKYNKKNTISKKTVGWSIFILLLLGVFIWGGVSIGQRHGENTLDSGDSNMKPEIVDRDMSSIKDVSVYVPGEDEESLTEKKVRIVDNKLKLNNKFEALIKILVAENYLPKNTHLIGKINVEEGVATVNFSEEIKGFSGSAMEESLLIQSFEKTLINKEDRIESVKIKVKGEDVESIGGHIDLSE